MPKDSGVVDYAAPAKPTPAKATTPAAAPTINNPYAAMIPALQAGVQLAADIGGKAAATAQVAQAKQTVADTATLIGGTVNPTTGYVVPPTAGSTGATPTDPSIQDAFALVQSQVAAWFGGDATLAKQAADFIVSQMQSNIGPNQALVDLRAQPFYLTRFAGNKIRTDAGLNALSEGDYVAAENEYAQVFQQYGLNKLDTAATKASLIGNAVSKVELGGRLDLAVNQVQNADPTVMATLKQYYPTINTADIVSYFLAPAETLPVLQQQVNAADVGAAAAQQGIPGLSVSKTRAEQLAQLGVTYQGAQAGYGKVAEVLTEGQKLSQIYKEAGINYNQTSAENQYLLNEGAAKLEQNKLNSLEQAQFSGRSGVVGASAAAGYSGSLGKSIQGKF